MKAVILAAGASTRTYPLTLTRPKALLPIANRKLLEYSIDSVKDFVDEIIIVVGYKKQMIKYFVDEHKDDIFNGLKITFVEQKEQLGTGHALLQVEGKIDGKFIVINGDDIYPAKSIKTMVSYDACILAQDVEDPSRFGIISVDKNHNLIDLVEKPSKSGSGLVNTGAYMLPKSIFDELKKLGKSKRGEIELTDAVLVLAKNGKVKVVLTNTWHPIGYPWHLLEANEAIVHNLSETQNKGEVEDGVKIKGKVKIGKNTLIKSGTYIEGPVIIGEQCVIGPNAFIRSGTIIGDYSKIGQAVEIKNSVIMDHTNASHLSYVGDSVVGSNCNLGAGTILANLRHDKKNVFSMVNGKLVDTGRRKFGSILGDGVHTGSNTMINPGRKIWAGKTTKPAEVVSKDIM